MLIPAAYRRISVTSGLLLAVLALTVWWVSAGAPLTVLHETTERVSEGALSAVVPAPAPIATYARAVLATQFGTLPLSFVPNAGQEDAPVRFEVNALGGMLYFTQDEVMLTLRNDEGGRIKDEGGRMKDEERDSSFILPPSSLTLQLRFVGANPETEITADERLPGIVNYFIGNDPAQWHTDLPTYGALVYHELYPGIDLRFDGAEGQLKSSYLVAPGADPARIRWRYDGASDVRIDEVTGDLIVVLPSPSGRISRPVIARSALCDEAISRVQGGDCFAKHVLSEVEGDARNDEPFPKFEIIERAPLAWQQIDEQRVPVNARYQLGDDGTVGFALGPYDAARPLTLDPMLTYTMTYGTYLGINGGGGASAIAVDGRGNAYVTGGAGAGHVFVAKLNATGSAFIYFTYLGGNAYESGSGIAVDGRGNAYVAGSTASTNFPTLNPFQANCALKGGRSCVGDVFVSKLSPTGALVYSTYLGGSGYGAGVSGRDQAYAIAVDSNGSAIVTGETRSGDDPNTPQYEGFPIKNAYQSTLKGDPIRSPSDAFVTKFTPNGSALVFSTYLGGTDLVSELGTGVAVDPAGNVYVTGYTDSKDFPRLNPYQGKNNSSFVTAFVSKFSPAGALLYSTYLGGSNGDFGNAIAADAAGNAYVTGSTTSSDFPLMNPYQSTLGGKIDAFVTKLNANGNGLVYSTYLGGSDGDSEGGSGIAVNAAGNAYVTGSTLASNFPVTNALQSTFGGACPDRYCFDAFVTKFTPGGSALVYSTYLGGSDSDNGRGIAVGSCGDVYVTGGTSSANFPTANALRPTSSGDVDGYVVLLSEDTDGDGIPDCWEKRGVTVDGVFINLPRLGADPMHKDLFVHADWMAGLRPRDAALKIVVDAFNAAPVMNPDGTTGIHLHVDLGAGSLMNPVTGEKWGNLSKAGSVPYQATIGSINASGDFDWTAVDNLKKLHFDPAKRAAVFHYACFCSNLPGALKGFSGLSRDIGAHDFLVTLGNWDAAHPGGTMLQQAGTFMHELGHNLGLRHGGVDDVNYKPNYLSVMNYTFQTEGLIKNDQTREFDYSRRELATLNERMLNEALGIGDPDRHYTLWNLRTRPDNPPGTNRCLADPNNYWRRLGNMIFDWNCDGLATPGTVAADINADGFCVGPGANGMIDTAPVGDDVIIGGIITDGPNRTCNTAKSGDDKQMKAVGADERDELKGFDDWAHIRFDGGGNIGQLGASFPMTTAVEVEPIAFEDIQNMVPPALLNAEATRPTAEFTATPVIGLAPLVVSFDGSAASDPDGTIASWSWNFGDGTTGSGMTTMHTYNAPGVYTATLTVQDNDGNKNLVTFRSPITAQSTNTAPTALFSVSGVANSAPLMLRFDGSLSFDPDGLIVAYAWDFGDGTTGAGEIITHTYAAFGTYTSTLTITDNDGASSVAVDANGPTAVTVSSFMAMVAPGAGVTVTWQTTFERDVAGFNLWRSERPDGGYQQLNADLIPARGPGNTYRYLDGTAVAGRAYYYRLQVVHANGNVEWIGPVPLAGSAPVLYLPLVGR